MTQVVRHLINANADKDKPVGEPRRNSILEEMEEDEEEKGEKEKEEPEPVPLDPFGNPIKVCVGDTPLLVATRFGHLKIVQ